MSTMNTRALDAIAALCGSRDPAPPLHLHSHTDPTSAGTTATGTASPSLHALIAQQLQFQEAQQAAILAQEAQAAAAQHAQAQARAQAQAAQQGQAARQAAFAAIPSDVLQAYLDRTTTDVRSPISASGHIAAIARAGATGFAGANMGSVSVQQDFAGLSGLHVRSQGVHTMSPDLNAEARAIATRIMMAQQKQPHPQRQYSPPSIALDRAPVATAPVPLVTQAPTFAPAEVISATHIMKMEHPHAQAMPSLSLSHAHPPSLPSSAAPPAHVIKTPPTKKAKKAKNQADPPQCGANISAAKRPPKKRHLRQGAQQGKKGVSKKNPTIKSVISEWENKKEAKRAANRLSAHLSRKRKKMFIDDLRDENQDLRRKEQILQSIPDLIVVFDSSGNMPFVSHSLSRFLNFTNDELQGASFWDILTQDSVRMIKNAFMDALAIKRQSEEDSTPLWGGRSMSVELVDHNIDDEDEICKLSVSLKGVVHFFGESPECVCSIRPEENRGAQHQVLLSGSNLKNDSEFSSPSSIVSAGSTAKGGAQEERPAFAVDVVGGTHTHRIKREM